MWWGWCLPQGVAAHERQVGEVPSPAALPHIYARLGETQIQLLAQPLSRTHDEPRYHGRGEVAGSWFSCTCHLQRIGLGLKSGLDQMKTTSP